MLKKDALNMLGGTVTSAARRIGVTVSAISQWPEELPESLADRVIAAIAREHLPPSMLIPAEQVKP